MNEVPVLKDWKGELTDEFEKASHKKEDLQKVISLGESFIEDIKPAEEWVRIHSQYVSLMTAQLRNLYATVYGESYNPRPRIVSLKTDSAIEELTTSEQRKKVVREVALDKTLPGMEISDKDILAEIEKQNYKFVSDNPSATVSTIMSGFKAEFEKVIGKKGIYKRKTVEKLITT